MKYLVIGRGYPLNPSGAYIVSDFASFIANSQTKGTAPLAIYSRWNTYQEAVTDSTARNFDEDPTDFLMHFAKVVMS
jgi:hypothetical protein